MPSYSLLLKKTSGKDVCHNTHRSYGIVHAAIYEAWAAYSQGELALLSAAQCGMGCAISSSRRTSRKFASLATCLPQGSPGLVKCCCCLSLPCVLYGAFTTKQYGGFACLQLPKASCLEDCSEGRRKSGATGTSAWHSLGLPMGELMMHAHSQPTLLLGR